MPPNNAIADAPTRKTAWTFQLFKAAPFQVAIDVQNMALSEIIIRRVVVERENDQIIGLRRKKVVEARLLESGAASFTIPLTEHDRTNDTYFSAHCVATRGVSGAGSWSWTLGVKQDDAKCPLSWGPIVTGSQCLTTGGIQDPCQGGHPFNGADVDDATILFDMILPPSGSAP